MLPSASMLYGVAMRLPPLTKGTLLRRYKRFLADVDLGGEVVTAHTANPGAMLGLTRAGSTVYLSHHDNPRRKLAYSWELIRVGRCWVGLDPIRSNALVDEGIDRGVISELSGYAERRNEVRVGESRLDRLLQSGDEHCYVEVKTATLVEDGVARFPDAVSVRGLRHLEELRELAQQGHRAVLCFVVQRADAHAVGPADAIDPDYGAKLREVARSGVEVIAYRATVSTRAISLRTKLQVDL